MVLLRGGERFEKDWRERTAPLQRGSRIPALQCADVQKGGAPPIPKRDMNDLALYGVRAEMTVFNSAEGGLSLLIQNNEGGSAADESGDFSPHSKDGEHHLEKNRERRTPLVQSVR